MTVAHKLADRLPLKWIAGQPLGHYLPVLKEPLQDLKETVFVARAESAAHGLDIILTMVGQYIFEPENRMGIREQMIEETFRARKS